MNLNQHKITQSGVTELRKAVERYIDRRIKTPADFTFLSDSIRERVAMSVSSTTLKRTWGYIRDAGSEYLPSRYTLCVLARFIGFRDYEDFIDNLHSVDVQSASYIGATVDSASLDEGIEVRITWSPGRSCRLRHLRGNEFEVVESHNGKLAVGDIVECGSFTMNAPLYFNRVRRPDGQQLTYVAGSRSGISFEIV